MLKKILISIIVVLVFCAFGAYFFFAGKLYSTNMPAQVCNGVKITLLDSLQNRFVTQTEVLEILDGFMGENKGKRVDEIDLNIAEMLLNQRSAIKESQVSITRAGQLRIDITQRKPVLRIQTQNGGFYVDESQYIFPLVPSFTSYVPIVSGNIPFAIDENYRGMANNDTGGWMKQIMELGNFISLDPFWNAQIEQIYVDRNGDIILSPRVGDHKIIFGDLKDIEVKFNKLYTFYKNIAPEKGWEKYSTINLKYRDQIVCKIKNKRKKQ